MRDYDYIIVGAGAAGLQLAYLMAKDSYFDSKKILILDKTPKTQNDRTWCFWEEGKGIFEDIVYKSWNTALFASDFFTESISLEPYTYKMIQGIDLYNFILAALEQHVAFDIKYERVTQIKDEHSHVNVVTENGIYEASKVFSSAFNPEAMRTQKKYPLLQQHFIGWFVKTENPIFNPEEVTFMDFAIPQKGNTRFMYVLPFSVNEALVEYTLFSETLLSDAEYELAIKNYLDEKQAGAYEIVDVERGSIPMTTFDFTSDNTANFLRIGIAGGWTKASTGYTFKNSQRKAQELISIIKRNDPIKKFNSANRFTFYDGILLDILKQKNHLGASIFSRLFKRNKAQQIFKFLEDKTTILEEIRIMASVADIHFTKAFFRYLVSKIKSK
ncbi:lycopene cyclase family protein [Ascidiimonas sp. W6]|uniref:lycopene cyclase family protein n=1 Tax=Ascidiimonas meishanensis TaxID=3128903 RepID=UPI0030EED9AE